MLGCLPDAIAAQAGLKGSMLIGGLGDDVYVVEPRRLVFVGELKLDLR